MSKRGRQIGTSIYDFRSWCKKCGEWRYPKALRCPECGYPMRNVSHDSTKSKYEV